MEHKSKMDENITDDSGVARLFKYWKGDKRGGMLKLVCLGKGTSCRSTTLGLVERVTRGAVPSPAGLGCAPYRLGVALVVAAGMQPFRIALLCRSICYGLARESAASLWILALEDDMPSEAPASLSKEERSVMLSPCCRLIGRGPSMPFVRFIVIS